MGKAFSTRLLLAACSLLSSYSLSSSISIPVLETIVVLRGFGGFFSSSLSMEPLPSCFSTLLVLFLLFLLVFYPADILVIFSDDLVDLPLFFRGLVVRLVSDSRSDGVRWSSETLCLVHSPCGVVLCVFWRFFNIIAYILFF